MNRPVRRALVMGLAMLSAASGLPAQNLEDAVERVENGDVVFRFPVNDGVEVCDDGIQVSGRWQRGRVRNGWQDRCSEGEAQVRLDVRRGKIRELDLERSGTGADTDLGMRSAEEAAAFLLGLARTSPRRDVAEDVIMPAMIARDVVSWPELVDMARDRRLDEDVREQAMFWLGQAAADVSRGESDYGSSEDDPETEVRDAAVFALSQRSEGESVPILMELARTSRHAKVRRSAVFWLSQTGGDRVVDFFEEVLLGG